MNAVALIMDFIISNKNTLLTIFIIALTIFFGVISNCTFFF